MIQKFNDFEYIIIDGNSNDNSKNIIKKYEQSIDKVKIEQDDGIYEAMNKGISIATGEYCLFLNSGDYLYNNDVLSNLFSLNLAEDIIYGIQMVNKNGILIEDPCLDVPYLTFRTLMKSHIPHQASFIKRSLFDKIGLYSEKNKVISDWEFIMLGLFRFNCSIRRIYRPINVYDTTGISSLPEFKSIQDFERDRSLKANFPLIYPDYLYFENFLNKRYIKITLKLRNTLKRIISVFK